MAQVSNVRKGPRPVTVETASQQIITAGNDPREIADALGRKLVIKRPGSLAKLRLFKAIGAENSKNEIYLGYAMLAIAVVSIDGVPVEPCMSERDIEALVQELADEGLEAVAAAFEGDMKPSAAQEAASAQNFQRPPSSG